tara:strand:- start:2694 stop:2891 length:198 start_codon:yes stop_codon:yes gene_type:complete
MRTRSNYELYHIFKQNGRTAKVYNTECGFEVDLYEGNNLIERKQLHKHSERYAEDCAENWVTLIF